MMFKNLVNSERKNAFAHNGLTDFIVSKPTLESILQMSFIEPTILPLY